MRKCLTRGNSITEERNEKKTVGKTHSKTQRIFMFS